MKRVIVYIFFFNIIFSQKIYGCGRNKEGQLGIRSDFDSIVPKEIIINDEKIKKVYTGEDSTYIITEENNLFVFGFNLEGQLGIGDFFNRHEPTKNNFFNKNIYLISSGYHTLIVLFILNKLTKDFKLFGFGYNEKGPIGIGNNINQNIPKEVSFFNNMPNIQDFCAGKKFFLT
jgi:alpha-tubulin suppressor-like RCC1 family protein